MSAPAWDDWAPAQGWDAFAAHAALSDALWDGLSEGEGGWHYLNPTSELSIWECEADGSALLIEYRDERIVRLQCDGGRARAHLAAVAAAFGLRAGQAASPPAD
ncbi:hypothetical protein J5226_14905 [Lysobacter sp. K5869]|uniref:hypothetical protein n=1 Tax=Lysobacter sp. K5869 TaxID=2820808 RepID=UPI001C062DAA|nr:hypothetical protein [Lysobacter sp. K5869]QWP74941.1 hypothetical protein J5226_14905 [Lysobacter sp. K5869]